VAELRDKPAGSIRITATDYATDTILWPKLTKFLRAYPDIRLEIITDYGLTDIVSERYDAGVRAGGQVAKDMIAVRIGPDLRMAVVGSPAYFKKQPEPKRPQDLIRHNCINLRLPTHGGLYAWEFEKAGRGLRVRVEGQLTFNGTWQMGTRRPQRRPTVFGTGSRGRNTRRAVRSGDHRTLPPRRVSSGFSRFSAPAISLCPNLPRPRASPLALPDFCF
jgi:DNA-binding transcriptional LysR family regulator